jgi:hypothetical protein
MAVKKTKALEMLGGTVTSVAKAVRLTASAVSQWPDELTPAIEDRVLAALARKHLPAELTGIDADPSIPTQEPSHVA